MKVEFYHKDEVNHGDLKFAVIPSRYESKWIYVRHNKRNTWEIPGGHIEEGETPIEAAKRELYEETGALDFNVDIVSIYSVEKDGIKTYGALLYADIKKLGELPHFEIEEIGLFEEVPKDLTYPLIQPYLHKKVLNHIGISK